MVLLHAVRLQHRVTQEALNLPVPQRNSAGRHLRYDNAHRDTVEHRFQKSLTLPLVHFGHLLLIDVAEVNGESPGGGIGIQVVGG